MFRCFRRLSAFQLTAIWRQRHGSLCCTHPFRGDLEAMACVYLYMIHRDISTGLRSKITYPSTCLTFATYFEEEFTLRMGLWFGCWICAITILISESDHPHTTPTLASFEKWRLWRIESIGQLGQLRLWVLFHLVVLAVLVLWKNRLRDAALGQVQGRGHKRGKMWQI